MNEEQRTNFIKALGLSGIQVTPEVAEVVSKIYEHIKAHNDYSFSVQKQIDNEVLEMFPKLEKKPDIGTAPQK